MSIIVHTRLKREGGPQALRPTLVMRQRQWRKQSIQNDRKPGPERRYRPNRRENCEIRL